MSPGNTTLAPNRKSDLYFSRLLADGYARLSQISAAYARMSSPHLQAILIGITTMLEYFRSLSQKLIRCHSASDMSGPSCPRQQQPMLLTVDCESSNHHEHYIPLLDI